MSAAGLDFGQQTKGQMDRSGYVPSFYMASPHTGDDLTAKVTYNGEVISVHGEELTVGMCPPAFRWAIGRPVNGRAEVLERHEFTRLFKLKVLDYYAFCGQRYDDDVDKEPIPNTRAYVAKKWDPDSGKVVPLGSGVELPQQDGPKKLYRQSSDSEVTLEEAEAESGKSRSEVLLHELAKMREKMEAQEREMAEAREAMARAAAPKPKREQPIVVAPCGKECKGTFGMKAHARACDACKASEAGPEAA